jgi:hypothetical protein
MKMKESEPSSLIIKSSRSSDGLVETMLGRGVNVGLSGGPEAYLEPAPVRAALEKADPVALSLEYVVRFVVTLCPVSSAGRLLSPPLRERNLCDPEAARLRPVADREERTVEVSLGSNPTFIMSM